MRLENVKLAIEQIVAHRYAHTRLLHPIFTECYAAFSAFLTESSIPLIDKQEARRRVRGHIEVCPAIAREVSGDRGHGVARSGRGDATRSGNVAEGPVALVPVKIVPRERKSIGTAVYRYTPVVTHGVIAGLRDVIQV